MRSIIQAATSASAPPFRVIEAQRVRFSSRGPADREPAGTSVTSRASLRG
jgi:hypothetical protein